MVFDFFAFFANPLRPSRMDVFTEDGSRNAPRTTEMSFDSVVSSDAESLVALRLEAMRDSLERIGRFDPVRARERFLSGFSPEHTRHILVGSERVGFVVVKPHEGSLLLDHFYIRPRFQRRGIGAAVLSAVFAQADAQSLPIRVGALRGSESNRFYVRHGFELVESGDWDHYYVRAGNGASTQPSPDKVPGSPRK